MIRIKINTLKETSGGDDISNFYQPSQLDLSQDGEVGEQLPQAWALHMPSGQPISHAQTANTVASPDTYPVKESEEVELDEDLLYEKKDRCYRLAKQKYDVFPSAYASGFIVRCRKGKVGRKRKKKLNEYSAADALETGGYVAGEELATKGLEKVGNIATQAGKRSLGNALAKGAGAAAGGASAIYGLATAERDGTWQTDLRNFLNSAGSFVGGTLGGIAGGAAGTALAPGAGTVAGGVAGGVVGSELGSKAGDALADVSQIIDDSYKLSKEQWQQKYPKLSNLFFNTKNQQQAVPKFSVPQPTVSTSTIKYMYEQIEIEEKRKKWSVKYKRSIDCDNPKGFSQRAHCQGRKKDESLDLESILSEIDNILEEGTFDKEKSQGLHGWFARKGGKGKSKGWVDCNTCRTNPKTGRKTCKTCGRQSGEERSKYPACRPTPSACNRRGTSKKRGPTRVSWKKKKTEE